MRFKLGSMVAAAAVLTSSAGAVAAAPAASGRLPTVQVALNGKSISIPRSIPSGASQFDVTVRSEKEGVLALVRLQPGVTVAKAFGLVQAHHNDPNALQGYASIVADYGAPSGSGQFQTVLTPGRYAALDFGPGGRPPVATFTVTKSSSTARLPRPAATVGEEEFKFTGPSRWHEGELVRFQNDGYLVHMAVAARFKNRATAVRAMKLLKAGNDRAAQKLAVGLADFMDSNSPGAMQQQHITAAPGVYVLACFMDTTDGREHTTLGMLKLVTITG